MNLDNDNLNNPQQEAGGGSPQPQDGGAGEQPPIPPQTPEQFPQTTDAPAYPYPVQEADGGLEPKEPAPKSNKTLFVILGVVGLIVVLLIAAFAFGFGGGDTPSGEEMKIPSRTQDPEGYLSAVYHNTMLEFQEGAPMIDFSRFTGKPVAHDFSLALNLADLIPYAPVNNVAISSSLKFGMEQQKILLDVSVAAGFINFADNQLYISPDTIALSIPSLFSRYKYITIDTERFAEDYKDSMFYSPYSELPPGFDLKEVITSMFEASESAANDKALINFQEQLEAHFETFKAAGQFQDEGTLSETINGKTVEVSKMSVTYPATDVDNLYLAFLDEYEEYMRNQMRMAALVDPSVDLDEDISYMMEVFDNFEFSSALVLRYTIKDDRVVRIESERCVLSYYDSYRDEYEDVGFEFVLEFLGEDSVTQDIRLSALFYDEYDDSFEMLFRYTENDTSDTYSRKFKLEFLTDYNDSFEFDLNFEWTPNSADERNLRITFEGYNGYSTIGMRVTGNLADSADGIALTKGNLGLYEDSEDLFEFDFEYHMYEIEPSELEIQLDDYVNFADLTERDLSAFF